MSNTVAFLFAAAAVVGGAIAYARWWSKHGGGKLIREREEAEAARRVARTKLNGWRYDPTPDGDIRYRVYGSTESGLDWKLVYDSDHGSSSSSPKLIFRADSLRPDAIEWQIFDCWSYDLMRKGVSGAILGGLVALGGAMSKSLAAKREFFVRSNVRPVGSDAFRTRFVLVADSANYDHMLTTQVENRILVWPPYKASMSKPDNCLSAGLDPTGLEVKLYVDGPSAEVIEQVAHLGAALAEASAASLRERGCQA